MVSLSRGLCGRYGELANCAEGRCPIFLTRRQKPRTSDRHGDLSEGAELKELSRLIVFVDWRQTCITTVFGSSIPDGAPYGGKQERGWPRHVDKRREVESLSHRLARSRSLVQIRSVS